jgi:energy-coupling factor transporter ATP-binding protein EcfA2
MVHAVFLQLTPTTGLLLDFSAGKLFHDDDSKYPGTIAPMVTPSGSTWKRWEPHAHTPETALNDQFTSVSWDDYISTLEGLKPSLVGIGVTDYFTTEGYRKVREYQTGRGHLSNVLLFANVEMRLAIGTADNQAVNIHLLVSPEDPEHLQKINDKLARLTYRFGVEDYECTPDGLRRLGRAWHAHSTGRRLDQVRAEVNEIGALRIGANQFKIDFTSLCGWRDQDPWLKANTLLAVPNGNDGVGGLPRGDGTFAATREALRRSAHVILSSNAKDKKYWLGQAIDSPDELIRKYGSIKPCLNGSDAHDLGRLTQPGDRLCWVKAEATWRGFLQVLVEPEGRLFIGPTPPDPPRTSWIKRIEVTGDPWCPAAPLNLNSGLVAVIGSRGSGKTALADLIAYGAEAYERGPASFLGKARNFVRNTAVSLTWGDDTTTSGRVDARVLGTVQDDLAEHPTEQGGVLYLSQHFVDSLCDPDRQKDRLRAEVERIVFQRLGPDEKLGAASFRELLERETTSLHDAKRSLETEVRYRSELIAQEYEGEKHLPEMRRKLALLDAEEKRIDANIKRIAPPAAKANQEALTKIQVGVTKREEELKNLAVRIKAIKDLQLELRTMAEDVRRRSSSLLMRVRVAYPELTTQQALAFTLSFDGDHASVLSEALTKLEKEASDLRGPSEAPYPPGCYMDLKAKLSEAQKALRDAGVIEKQLGELIEARAKKEQEHKALAEQIEHTAKARDRIKEHQIERLAAYKGCISMLADEEAVLQRLYKPLEQELGELNMSERRLTLVVRRRADVAAWVRMGTALFDMRKRHVVTEPGKLEELASEHLVPAWEGAADSGEAVRTVLSELGDIPTLRQCFVADTTLEQMATWLFSTDHVRVDYGITYDGVAIEQLSPGTRGVVLLILYLHLDTTDDRPLIIDQPEENLDPKSVFADLVRFFKAARQRRQIIMVTHNANLVVNADADQILIANGTRSDQPGPPVLSYQVAVLEDETSQKDICAILEGGVEAFSQRDRRYKVAMVAQVD